MKRKQNIRSGQFEIVRRQVRRGTPDTIIELIARQLERADDARDRIEREGSVVRDVRGSVVPHPALGIEATATKIAADLLGRHKGSR